MMIQREVLDYWAFLAFSDEEMFPESVCGSSKKCHFLTNEGANARAICAGPGGFPRREITKNAHFMSLTILETLVFPYSAHTLQKAEIIIHTLYCRQTIPRTVNGSCLRQEGDAR
jgi:hypothetical protein